MSTEYDESLRVAQKVDRIVTKGILAAWKINRRRWKVSQLHGMFTEDDRRSPGARRVDRSLWRVFRRHGKSTEFYQRSPSGTKS